MISDLHYLVGYAKARMFIQKVAAAAVPANTKPVPTPVSREAFAAGAAWSPTVRGYVNTTQNNPYNFHENDTSKRFHIIDPSLTTAQYKQEDRKYREDLEKAKAKARASSWWLTRWWNGRAANKMQGAYDKFRRDHADAAAKRMESAGPGMDFLQLWGAQRANPTMSPAVAVTTGGNKEERTNMFRSVLNDVQNEFSARDDRARGFKVTPAWGS